MKKKAQTLIEYTILVIIVMAALLAIGSYIKRGLQGRWKVVTDELGDQYDPRYANSLIIRTISLNSQTEITTVDSVNGFWTLRKDYTNSYEDNVGDVRIGSYN